MRLKRIALRGLIILMVAVAVCMFFARTVQTITTPKVQLVTASNGRFEDKLTFQAEVYFPETEAVVVSQAAQSAVTVDKIRVKPGYWVNAGDVVFTCKVTGVADEMKKLREEYDTKSKELMDLDVQNRRLSKESRQNELYQTMIEAQAALTDAVIAARTLAGQNNVTISGDVSGWEKQLAFFKNVPEEVKAAVGKAQTAAETYNAANAAYLEILEDRKLKVSTEVFEYIQKRSDYQKQLDKLAEQMVNLSVLAEGLTQVTAEHSGYIVSVAVNEGDAYDGTKTAYTISKEGTLPLLRTPLEGVKRTIADGTKAEIESSSYGTEKTTVDKTAVEADGKKYLYINMPASLSGENNSAIRRTMADGGVNVKVTYRAAQNTTLITPSAVRAEGDNNYVYLVQTERGGLLSSDMMKVVKTSVTVIERSDKYVSVAEEFGYQQIADREDRALSDGQAVMEYVN